MTTIKEQIEELKSFLTGDLFQDGDILQKIYELKKQLNPEIETNPDADKTTLQESKETLARYFIDLRALTKLQWEEDHERVGYGDE
jgi:hypothetical protein